MELTYNDKMLYYVCDSWEALPKSSRRWIIWKVACKTTIHSLREILDTWRSLFNILTREP